MGPECNRFVKIVTGLMSCQSDAIVCVRACVRVRLQAREGLVSEHKGRGGGRRIGVSKGRRCWGLGGPGGLDVRVRCEFIEIFGVARVCGNVIVILSQLTPDSSPPACVSRCVLECEYTHAKARRCTHAPCDVAHRPPRARCARAWSRLTRHLSCHNILNAGGCHNRALSSGHVDAGIDPATRPSAHRVRAAHECGADSRGISAVTISSTWAGATTEL